MAFVLSGFAADDVIGTGQWRAAEALHQAARKLRRSAAIRKSAFR
jgi:hypothetical protein